MYLLGMDLLGLGMGWVDWDEVRLLPGIKLLSGSLSPSVRCPPSSFHQRQAS